MKKFKIALLCFLLVVIGALSYFYFQNVTVDVMDPKGWVGIRQKDLLLVATYLMLIVVVPVFGLIGFVLLKYRANNKDAKYDPNWDYSLLAESLWWGVPFVIIVILSVITYMSSHELDPFKPLDSKVKPVKIQVVALQWKWLFIYPEEKIATVNFIQFPVNTPINFDITSDAPMNSFWIPQLGGQIYAMSGMSTKLHLIADTEGSYNGLSANISGEGFSGMTFVAKASSNEEYQQWLDEARGSSEVLDQQSYQQLLIPSKYNKVELYQLGDEELYQQIVMKYMEPKGMQHEHHGK